MKLFRFVFFSILVFLNGIYPYAWSEVGMMRLPKLGVMMDISPAHEPIMIKGLIIHPDQPFNIDFIVDLGQDFEQNKVLKDQGLLKEEANRLIKYFLASLTVPQKDQWVNLSPYEKNRIIPNALGQTALGRDLLAQDYILKQITASLTYPDKDLGKQFWKQVYRLQDEDKSKTTVSRDALNKVWIVADDVAVYEKNHTLMVTKAHLKVMVEDDFLALRQTGHKGIQQFKHNLPISQLIPILEKEVNEGRHFAPLRQIFQTAILATWYKARLKDTVLNTQYSDLSIIDGTQAENSLEPKDIYTQYLKAYQRGVYHLIKVDDQQPQPRKYFAGGTSLAMLVKPDTQQPKLDLNRLVILSTELIENKNSNPRFILNQTRNQAMQINHKRLSVFLGFALLGTGIVLKQAQDSESNDGNGRLTAWIRQMIQGIPRVGDRIVGKYETISLENRLRSIRKKYGVNHVPVTGAWGFAGKTGQEIVDTTGVDLIPVFLEMNGLTNLQEKVVKGQVYLPGAMRGEWKFIMEEGAELSKEQVDLIYKTITKNPKRMVYLRKEVQFRPIEFPITQETDIVLYPSVADRDRIKKFPHMEVVKNVSLVKNMEELAVSYGIPKDLYQSFYQINGVEKGSEMPKFKSLVIVGVYRSGYFLRVSKINSEISQSELSLQLSGNQDILNHQSIFVIDKQGNRKEVPFPIIFLEGQHHLYFWVTKEEMASLKNKTKNKAMRVEGNWSKEVHEAKYGGIDLSIGLESAQRYQSKEPMAIDSPIQSLTPFIYNISQIANYQDIWKER